MPELKGTKLERLGVTQDITDCTSLAEDILMQDGRWARRVAVSNVVS